MLRISCRRYLTMNSTKSTGTKSSNAKTTGKTKGCSNKASNCSNCGGKSSRSKNSKSSAQESDSDPSGSYTGNPVGWGKYADPVQDADDL